MLSSIGENPEREGLRDTPVRAAKALMFFTKARTLTKFIHEYVSSN